MRDCNLGDLKAGEAGCIKAFCECEFARKMLSMGISPGQHLKVMRKMPLGGSLYVAVADRALALRASEARQITVTR